MSGLHGAPERYAGSAGQEQKARPTAAPKLADMGGTKALL
jgi:hypothetical protein